MIYYRLSADPDKIVKNIVGVTINVTTMDAIVFIGKINVH